VDKKITIILGDQLLHLIEEYRVERFRETGRIPKMSEAVVELIREGLRGCWARKVEE